ncbi:hypothetical protein E3V39_11790 [Gammaproteobacteria bacterium LSUCC0112]|nr:hypothetical protein E3V39_11790 [Gammaproteobacteria bacterium LSUCC0112]
MSLTRISKDRLFDLLFGYVGHASQFISGFVTMFIITKYSGIGVYGIWVALNAVQTFTSRVISVPTNEAYFYFSSKKPSTNSKVSILLLSLSIDLVVGLMLIIVAYLFGAYLIDLLFDGEIYASYITYYFVYAFFLSIRTFSVAYWLNNDGYKKSVLLGVLEQTIKLLLLTYFFIYLQEEEIYYVIIAVLISTAPISMIFLVAPAKYLIKNWLFFDKSNFKDHFTQYAKYTKKAYASFVLNGIIKSVDNLLVSILFSNQVVGLYATIKQFAMPLNFAIAPIINLSYRSFSKSLADNKLSAITNVIYRSLKLLIIVSIPIFIITLTMLFLYGNVQDLNFESTDYLIFVFSFSTTAIGVFYWWARPFASVYDPTLSLRAQFVFIVVYSILIYPLSINIGLLGFCLALFLCSVVLLFYWFRILWVLRSSKLVSLE